MGDASQADLVSLILVHWTHIFFSCCQPKATVRLEMSIRIFGCHCHSFHDVSLWINDQRVRNIIRDWVFFLWNCNEQINQRQFIFNRSKCWCWQKPNTYFGSTRRIYWIAYNYKTVKCSVILLAVIFHRVSEKKTETIFRTFVFIHQFSLIAGFSDIYDGFVTILFIWSLVTICGALLMLQMQIVQYSNI